MTIDDNTPLLNDAGVNFEDLGYLRKIIDYNKPERPMPNITKAKIKTIVDLYAENLGNISDTKLVFESGLSRDQVLQLKSEIKYIIKTYPSDIPQPFTNKSK